MTDKILITGATGFLGRYLVNGLQGDIITIGRNNCNINHDLQFSGLNFQDRYDLVIHAAGKAHVVPKSDLDKKLFHKVNVQGTSNLLNALRVNPPKKFVLISSVAVYGLDKGVMVKENDPTLANDPYGKSKLLSEKLVSEWCRENNVICTILRLPLVAGKNPLGNLRSMVNGLEKGYYFNIAGGSAKKSMVLAEDVAKIIPYAATIGGIYNLTDRYHPTFYELSRNIARQLGKPRPLSIPRWCVFLMANVGNFFGTSAPINSRKLKKITSDLTFDDQKAVEAFGWNPTPVLKGFKIR